MEPRDEDKRTFSIKLENFDRFLNVIKPKLAPGKRLVF